MVRGRKVSSKHNSRNGARSKEDGVSDDSDEDYVVSDEGRDASDNSEYYCSSLDGCASEDSLDSFIVKGEEDEEEEFHGVGNSNRSKARNTRKVLRKGRRITREEEEEEEEIRFNRSRAGNGDCGQQKNGSKASRKRGRIAYAEQLEDEEEKVERVGHEEDEEKVETDGEKDGEGKQLQVKEEEDDEYKVEDDVDEDEYKVEEEEEDGDEDDEEDFDCEYDDEITPEEEDYSDEEEEIRVRKKKNNGMKMGKKVSLKRAPVVCARGRKRQSTRASKKPLRKQRRKNGGFRKRARYDSEDDFINNGSPIRTTSRKKRVRKRRKLVLADSGSDHVSSGSSDVEYTISEEEREQLREANELCGRSRNNLRSSSLLTKSEEVGVHDDLHQQHKPPGRKGKEKIEEPQGRKGKEKVVGSKSEVVKQVCGICLSEEDKRRTRGVLDCCTHYFCFACINEWAKVESRCPLCKQRFKTISKPARSTAGIDLREVVIQIPERDQVYQPSEEELRSYIDPYESVICSECHQGGDDGLMLLCDICDSPSHTYCVGLGREVPEGNWYCDGCRPVALGSSTYQVQECVADPRETVQPIRQLPPVLNVSESIDLNLESSPQAAFNLGFGQFSSSRFNGRSVQGVSPVSGGGAPTLSGRRWIHRHIHQILSMDRMTSTTGRTGVIPATSSTSNIYSSQIVQGRETTTQHIRTQDVGTSHDTFFDETLCNNNASQLMQNGALWPGLLGTPPIPDCEQVHQFSTINTIPDGNLSPFVREGNSNIAMEQLQSMVKRHLTSLCQNIDLGHDTLNDIGKSSMHTILAACGLEHNQSEVFNVPPPPVCQHIERMACPQTSLIKGCCSSCFDSFIGDVVKRILDTRISSQTQWLKLAL
ncbi:PREDICTED: bromodomain adjacent to zinc finger domain protein 1A-like [Lupinus angustifolius]|uniref:bromodomain adjacent to zinc finger domain protein 1A-like n=1 Tax=Lupinus angustifolius TaxID=3871 RepID=UPI00092E9574|nr:PREDICTED: bromodomain adjacent to zinc finger domain protein 1A-like [Lupinus angustifolius]